MRKNLVSFIVAAFLCAICRSTFATAPAVTVISDTVYKSDASLFTGKAVITWPNFLTADSKPVIGSTKTVNITSGVLSVSLAPNAGGTPSGTSYKVVYNDPSGGSSTEYWVVPSSGSPVTLSAIRVTAMPSPFVVLSPGQITGTAIVATPASAQSITAPAVASVVPLAIKGNATAAADVLDIYDSAGTPAKQSYFDSSAALHTTKAITSTLATGTAPFTVASTTNVANLNASTLSGATFSAPGAIGGGTPGTAAFTSLSAGTAKWNVNTSGLETQSNNLTLAGQGKPLILGITSQRSETTSADANVLTVTPASAAGSYELCVVISVSAATSGVIGWTATWTDSNGNAQTPTELELFQNGTAAPALTFTTSAASNYHACASIDVNNAGTAIVIKWIGGGTTTAKMSAWVKRII